MNGPRARILVDGGGFEAAQALIRAGALEAEEATGLVSRAGRTLAAVLASIEGSPEPTALCRDLTDGEAIALVRGSSVVVVVDGAARDLLGRRHPGVLAAVEQARSALGGVPRNLTFNDRVLPLSQRAHYMGIVNVTPDSFSDGGRYLDPDAAIKQGARLVEEGADLLDIGGESTRPGAEPVDEAEEIKRVVPVIEGLTAVVDVPISIDTMKASVAAAALDAGASIVNDVSAGRFDPTILPLAAECGVPLILMHMLGEPRTMQADPRYDDVVGEVWRFLAERADAAVSAGVSPQRILVDPGFGFGKTREHNLVLLKRLREFTCLGYPVLVGTSRKSFIGTTLDLPVGERVEGTAATVALAVSHGAAILRVHEVGPMRRVGSMVEAVVRVNETRGSQG